MSVTLALGRYKQDDHSASEDRVRYVRPLLKNKIKTEGPITWHIPVISRKLRLDDYQFKVSLGYSDILSQNKQRR